jgi:phytoene dehydrogenase-like protein
LTTAAREYDAIVIGSGPNGLAAAITLARSQRSVLVIEGQQTIGGATRSEELTLPGFVHDVCSTVYGMAAASPFFRAIPLDKHGLEWALPTAPLAHPLGDGSAIIVERSIEETARQLSEDANQYSKIFGGMVADWPKLEPIILGPPRVPIHGVAAARFGLLAMESASGLARRLFRGAAARAVFAGQAAHAILPLENVPSAAFGLVLGATAHLTGWPFAKGGSQNVANALASYFQSLGGEIVTGQTVDSLEDLPHSRAVLCDVTPQQFLRMVRQPLPRPFRAELERFRYGPGVCKIDWALNAPIPWTAKDCARAGTVHLGGTLEELCESERAPWHDEHAQRPFVLLAQPTLFDSTRAPAGKHIAWAYCHVPNGSTFDMSDRIEAQIERFAPGFRQIVLQRRVQLCPELESHNPNLVGGDITGGASLLSQLFFRPTGRIYRTPLKGVYFCSASTPPGGGVHGMCGYFAAKTALRDGL